MRLTAQEVKGFRASMKRQREKDRDMARKEVRRLKREEVIQPELPDAPYSWRTVRGMFYGEEFSY